MQETINDRIESLINERFDGNKAAFCKLIGLPPSGMGNYLGKQRRSKPSVDIITKIITKLGVDPGWLLTGEEKMVEEKIDDGEEIVLPPDCPDEAKHALNILQAQMGLLGRILEEKDKLIAEKDIRIAELKERIEELKATR